MPHKNSTYELMFTRQCSFITLQIWYRAENELASMYARIPFPKNGYMFFEYEKGIAKNYINLHAVERISRKALAAILQDKKRFFIIENGFWKQYSMLKPYLAGKRKIRSEREFHQVAEALARVWALQVLPYWFGFFDFPELPAEIKKKSERIRLQVENIIRDTDWILGEFKEMKPKRKYLIFFKSQCFYNLSLQAFLKREGKKSFAPNLQTRFNQIRGSSAYPGLVMGRANIVLTAKHSKNMAKGDILVTGYTSPDFMPAIRKAAAIVTDEGGMLSHAAIVAREFKIPCVVGTKVATKVLKQKMLIEVNATTGIISRI